MRYTRIDSRNPAATPHVAAVWPRIEEALAERDSPRADASSILSPAAAAPDVPAAVGRMIVAAYATLVGVFFALFARSPAALLVISVCAVFVAVFFTVPRLFFAVEADRARRPSLARFMRVGLDTLTGRSGGGEALVQMLIVPVLLTLGLGAMGVIGLIFLP